MPLLPTPTHLPPSTCRRPTPHDTDMPVLAVSIGLTVAKAFGAFQREDQYLPYLQDINQTTHQILVSAARCTWCPCQ